MRDPMKIDFVIPWVDGSDPKWLEEKRKYQPKDQNASNSSNRFRDWELMQFWFRSVEKYTPWVNKIHFLTWGHVPKFLNTNHAKINIVKHQDFIPLEYLPTFSSHVIEMNLHRIPGLSDHFVYFNDDTFMLRPMNRTDFFREGYPCTYGGEIPIELVGHIGIWQHAAVNDLGIVNAHFPKREAVAKYKNKYINRKYRWQDNTRTFLLEKFHPDYFTGFKNLHAPAAYLKKTFCEVWEAEAEKLDATCRNRFRTSDDVNQWVMLWWQIASGSFHPSVVDNIVSVVDEQSIQKLCKIITEQTHDMICINDPEYDIDFIRMSAKLRDAFETILHEKSSFER